MADLKVRKGGSWVDIKPKKRTSSGWVDADVYKRVNGKWVKMSSRKFTKTYNATWTQTYREAGTKRTDYRSEKLCQGRYVLEPWGVMRSLIGFGSVVNDLKGATINKVELYLRNEHWYYYAGGTAVLGYHNHSVRPTKFSHSKSGAVKQKYTARGQAKWITLPNAFGNGLRDKKYRGVSVFINSTNMGYYGIFYGAKDGSNKPKLKITYTK